MNQINRIIEITGASQREIAEIVGVDPDTISAMARGKQRIYVDVITKCLSHFGLSAQWVMTGEGPKRKSEETILTGQHARDFQDYPEIGTALVLDVVLFVDTWLTENGLTMPPTKKVEMVKVLCRFLVKRDRERGKVSSAEENIIHLREYADFLKAASA
ncbi:MAG: helix-turn-helix transcriptional regulator [Magnetococcales bacterium]|nr:helix-turn-helix transcriptional regulator [Magnetococcales bacterium]